jgi:hypothetical protein
MDLHSKVVIGTYWHGVATEAAWLVLSHGGGLRLPAPGEHAHDPGDYGLAVYLTDVKARAKSYATRVGGKLTLLECRVHLENALVFDWREGSALDPKHPMNVQTDFFERLYGDPIHGSPEDRRRVAEKWRARLIDRGYDGVIVVRRDETEVAVYCPETSISEIRVDGGDDARTV